MWLGQPRACMDSGAQLPLHPCQGHKRHAGDMLPAACMASTFSCRGDLLEGELDYGATKLRNCNMIPAGQNRHH